MLDGLVAQWIRHLTTNQGIPGSSPGKIVLESAFQKRKMSRHRLYGTEKSVQGNNPSALWPNG